MDKESSLLEERFIVSEGICEELDRRKVHAQKVCTVTSQVAQREIESLPPYVESCRIIYVPEIGYLLTIKQWKEKLTQEEMNFPGLEFKVRLHKKTQEEMNFPGLEFKVRLYKKTWCTFFTLIIM
uniref:MutS protein homolog 5 n=1 Tax=Cacopsylla melanoneura TaxID=428564 RepID=A0A8D8WDM7_9HEMI